MLQKNYWTMPKIKRIDGEQRFYEIDGVKYPSVTTVLNVVNKPAIGFWYRKEALLEVERNWETLASKLTAGVHIEDALKEITALAKSKPDEILQEALDIGSEVHKHLEFITKKWIATGKMQVGGLVVSTEAVDNCLQAFYHWAEMHKFQPIESELTVYSKKLGYAGTLDAIGKVDGKLAVVDYKSSKACYPEMGMQLSAYRHAYAEMRGERKVDEMWILRLGKNDGEFEAVRYNAPAKQMLGFKGALKLWKWKQEMTTKK